MRFFHWCDLQNEEDHIFFLHLRFKTYTMTKYILTFTLYFSMFIIACGLKAKDETSSSSTKLKNGDIIFQTTSSAQCKAVQLATHSIYSHCGLVFVLDSGVYVLEAVQPVKWTKFKDWTSHGEGGHYVVKRVKADQALTDETLKKLKTTGEKYLGKNYDLYFDWSDDRIYCSELVWKVYYQLTGLEVGKLQLLREFDLSSKQVKAKLKERYGNNIPLGSKVISPQSIFASGLLVMVEEK